MVGIGWGCPSVSGKGLPSPLEPKSWSPTEAGDGQKIGSALGK